MQYNKIYILIIALVVVAVLGAVYFSVSGRFGPVAGNSSPVVGNGDTIEVYYTGTLTNGTVFDSNVGRQPLQFTVGSNQIIPGFDQGVLGMRLNETRNITIPASEAYGQVNPALIIMVPVSAFQNQTVQPGMIVTQNTSSGEASGIITAVNATTATIDFNPPLAGQTLIFEIKVVGIEKA